METEMIVIIIVLALNCLLLISLMYIGIGIALKEIMKKGWNIPKSKWGSALIVIAWPVAVPCVVFVALRKFIHLSLRGMLITQWWILWELRMTLREAIEKVIVLIIWKIRRWCRR